MVNSAVLLIVIVVIVLGILLSFGLFFLLRNSDTEQTSNVLIASPSTTALPFASCQTSSQCLTSQICSNGRCTNVVENVQNNLASTFSAPQPVPVVPVTGITEPVVEDNITQEIENLERLMERQNGDLRSLQTTLERHIESNQSKLSNLENTIISKGVRDLPPPSTRRSNIRDLPPPSYVQDDEDFTEPLPVQEGGSTTIQSVNNLPLRGNTSLSTQATGLSTAQSVNNLPTQVNNLPTRGTVQQPTFNLPLRSTYIAQQTATLAQQPVPLQQTTSVRQTVPLQQPVSSLQQPVQQPTQGITSVQQPVSSLQQQPVVLSGAVVNPTLTAQPVPITGPSTVVLSGNNNLPRSNNLANRNPYINGDDPFEQFAQQDLPPPAILQTRPVREERKNCRKDASCPLVPAEVPRYKRNKDRKAVVWQL
nr:DNA segregation ATPase domain protein [Cedratvirus borely]